MAVKKQKLALKKAREKKKKLAHSTIVDSNVDRMETHDETTRSSDASSSLNLRWNKDAAAKEKFYSHSGAVSKRHINKRKQANRERAKGSATLDGFVIFESTTTNVETGEQEDIVMEESAIDLQNSEEEAKLSLAVYKAKVRDAFNELSEFLTPVMRVDSVQQKIGSYEMKKYYEAVCEYFNVMISTDQWKKMEASNIANNRIYKLRATSYRATQIREYAKEYLAVGSITPSAQGKHSKRVSILDDNDIKRKIMEWFRGQARTQRSIPALTKYLQEEVLPEKIDSDTLNKETLVDGTTINPLCPETLRKRIVAWGFSFKALGKFKHIFNIN